jgi:ceramide glucosyltransferase
MDNGSLVHISLLHVLAAISAAATLASTGYCILGIVAGVRFATQRRSEPESVVAKLPLVSILKPLKGADPQMYDALRSHCLQDYPDYEILCGVTASDDPAAPVVEKLIREFPQRKIRLLLCDKRLGANGKVSSLIQLVGSAKGENLLVNDSDIRVEPDYLRTVMSELRAPDTGLVTCLYRGVAHATLGSRLEALGISTDFTPGVLAARVIEGGIHFGLGSTLAFRKGDLDAIGGFESIADNLADDYELGRRIGERKNVQLSAAVVETHLPAYDMSGFLSHQLRWARTIRASRVGGYAGLPLTFTLPWALMTALLCRGSIWAWMLFAVALFTRGLMAIVSSRVVLGERSIAPLFLVPVRDLVAVAVWIGGWFGNSVLWRGERFLLKDGRLIRK